LDEDITTIRLNQKTSDRSDNMVLAMSHMIISRIEKWISMNRTWKRSCKVLYHTFFEYDNDDYS